MRILMLGNSLTSAQDMPDILAELTGAEVVCHTRGGARLSEHLNPNTRLGARTQAALAKKQWDYVVLQEHAHPFGPEEKFFEAARKLNAWIREANSTPVIYMTWAMKEEEAVQPRMTKAHQEIAEEIDALLAPVGEEWWQYKKNHPEIEMYAEDGAHASPAGSDLAASCIWETIRADLEKK